MFGNIDQTFKLPDVWKLPVAVTRRFLFINHFYFAGCLLPGYGVVVQLMAAQPGPPDKTVIEKGQFRGQEFRRYLTYLFLSLTRAFAILARDLKDVPFFQ